MDDIKKKIWAVGGGKGGIGKSIVSLMIGRSLARQNKKVIIIDADLGGSNLHTLAGIKFPLYTLGDFIKRRVESIEEIVIETPVHNLKMICGADDILGLANPKSAQKTRIFNHMKKLEADYIILDLGAGTSFTTMDFFLYAPNKICVLTPQITSIQNAYGFIKASLYRGLNRLFRRDFEARDLIKRAGAAVQGESIDSIEKLKEELRELGEGREEMLSNYLEGLKIMTIINMVRNDREKEVGRIVSSVAENYLGLALENIGIVQYDNIISTSINQMAEFLKSKKETIAGASFYNIARDIIKRDQPSAVPQRRFGINVPAGSL